MEQLIRLIGEGALVGLDTCVFIYHFERHPVYHAVTAPLLGAVAAGRLLAVTSVVSLMEIEVRPLQLRRPDIASEYETLLLHFPHLDVVDVTVSIARTAAELRALHRLKPADALQIAACLESGARAFVINDRGIRGPIGGLEIVQLEQLAGSAGEQT